MTNQRHNRRARGLYGNLDAIKGHVAEGIFETGEGVTRVGWNSIFALLIDPSRSLATRGERCQEEGEQSLDLLTF